MTSQANAINLSRVVSPERQFQLLPPIRGIARPDQMILRHELIKVIQLNRLAANSKMFPTWLIEPCVGMAVRDHASRAGAIAEAKGNNPQSQKNVVDFQVDATVAYMNNRQDPLNLRISAFLNSDMQEVDILGVLEDGQRYDVNLSALRARLALAIVLDQGYADTSTYRISPPYDYRVKVTGIKNSNRVSEVAQSNPFAASVLRITTHHSAVQNQNGTTIRVRQNTYGVVRHEEIPPKEIQDNNGIRRQKPIEVAALEALAKIYKDRGGKNVPREHRSEAEQHINDRIVDAFIKPNSPLSGFVIPLVSIYSLRKENPSIIPPIAS